MEKKKMGRPPKYTKEEARKVFIQQQWKYAKRVYERIATDYPKGTNERMKNAAQKLGISKRAFVIGAVEKRLEEVENS